MIRKSKNGSSNAFNGVMSKIRETITGGMRLLPAKDKVSNIGISVESYGADDAVMFDNAIEHLERNYSSISTEAFRLVDQMDANSANQGGLNYTSLQNKNWMEENQQRVSVEAATILSMAHNSPGKYLEIKPTEFGSDVRLNQLQTSGSYGTLGVIGEDARPSLESFDETETEKWREFSYAVNLMAAKTHPFAELFYPLYVTTPENAGWLMSIRRTMVWEGYQQTELTGKAVKMKKTNALEALLEYKVLETDSTYLYPVLTDENKEWFVEDAVIAPQDMEQGADKFQTQYLLFNTDHPFNLINLAQTPSRMAKGAPNFTDSLDRRIALKEVILKITSAAGAGYVKLQVNRDTNAQFLAPREYNFRDMHLKFHPKDLALQPDLKDTDGGDIGALKPLFDKGYGVVFGMKIDGEANVETGNAAVRVANVQPLYVYDLTDPKVTLELDDPLVAADVPTLISAEGFSLEARLTNLNQLERGKLVDSDVQKEGFIIPTLAPICIVKPSQMDDEKVYPKIESLQFVYRTALRNDAVTAILNRAEVLEQTLGNGVTHPLESHLGMEGLGQYYYRPHFERIEIDVEKELNNITSNAKLSDIQGLIVTRINEAIYRVNKLTGYSAALEEQFPGSTPKPHVGIGTDLYLPQFIMVPGDDRTVSIGFDHTIASISDLRMSNKIVMQFTLPGEKEPHPMQSGVCGMIPEFLANFQMIRDQRIANEIRLTPRYRYFNYTCVMILIEVVNLDKAVAKRTELNVNDKTVTAFPGETTPPDSYEDGETEIRKEV